MQSSRIGSALVCVHRNAQNCEPNLPVSTRFFVITDMMVAVSIHPPTGFPVSPSPFSSQSIPSHETTLASDRARGETPTISLALGANLEGKKKLKGKAGRIPRSRIGSALVCVRRNAQHLGLHLPELTRVLFITELSWLLYPPVGPLVV